ncbi:hypothetical protein, partial [Massilia timonae]|uniref:hypothetical protein n=1 Tax=Massilia timonae TaxID=47229 RepID=UPI00289B5BF5
MLGQRTLSRIARWRGELLNKSTLTLIILQRNLGQTGSSSSAHSSAIRQSLHSLPYLHLNRSNQQKNNQGQSRFIGQFLKVAKQFDSDPHCLLSSLTPEKARLGGELLGILESCQTIRHSYIEGAAAELVYDGDEAV